MTPSKSSKCDALSGSGDVDLIRWHKQEEPIIPHPPENMKLTGFRDPYIIQQGHGQQKWKMLLGSGLEGQGGTLLVYETTHLSSGHHSCHPLHYTSPVNVFQLFALLGDFCGHDS